jgi:hypothetical protein
MFKHSHFIDALLYIGKKPQPKATAKRIAIPFERQRLRHRSRSKFL